MHLQTYFSVIVPTHKRPMLLRRALQSLRSQSAPMGLEIIVVSDAADADTDAVCAELLTSADIYARRNGQPGPSASRNLGLSLAKGRHVLLLDDDDAWHPGLLEQLHAQAPVRQGDPVYANCTVVKERRLPQGPEQMGEVLLNLAGQLTEDVYVKNQIHMSCFAFPRALLQGIMFDTFMRAYEDWDFLLSVFDRQMPVHVPIVGSRVFEVDDDTSDRRGSSQSAIDFNAVLDYLYVYRRHPAPSEAVRQKRAELMRICGISVSSDML